MDMLHAKYIKIVPTGGDLSAATEMDLAGEKVDVTLTPEIVEHVISKSSIAKERYRIGTDIVVAGVFGNATLQQIQTLLGGTITNDVYTRGQGIETLAQYDIELGVVRPSDGQIVEHTFTKMNFAAAVKFGFETKKKSYLPFEAKATSESDVTIDNS